jgi:hypothetical protein
MAKRVLKTGKKTRPKTAVKGKRYRCALCHKRSPKPVKTPAPWYCARCVGESLAKGCGKKPGPTSTLPELLPRSEHLPARKARSTSQSKRIMLPDKPREPL